MKRVVSLGILLILLVYILPLLFQFSQKNAGEVLDIHRVKNVENLFDSQGSATENAENDSQQTDSPTDSNTDASQHTISVQVNGTAVTMPLEEYAAGAAAAEMPADFPNEALKAQVIAARTYAVYKQSLGTDEVHPDAVVCDDYTHCAAFVDLSDDTATQKLWGENAVSLREKLEQAAMDTAGQVITYEGQPIAAVFHSAAAGKTEAAVSVWGTDVPYLTEVDSTGDDACPKYDASVTYSAEEFRQRMLIPYPDINLTGLPNTWFTDMVSSDAGGVTSCKIGGVEVAGTQVRTWFDLNSTHFSVSTTDTSITFHTEGYGHGVGMSQYGAKAMAENGSTCEDILLHYYTGTAMTKLD